MINCERFGEKIKETTAATLDENINIAADDVNHSHHVCCSNRRKKKHRHKQRKESKGSREWRVEEKRGKRIDQNDSKRASEDQRRGGRTTIAVTCSPQPHIPNNKPSKVKQRQRNHSDVYDS